MIKVIMIDIHLGIKIMMIMKFVIKMEPDLHLSQLHQFMDIQNSKTYYLQKHPTFPLQTTKPHRIHHHFSMSNILQQPNKSNFQTPKTDQIHQNISASKITPLNTSLHRYPNPKSVDSSSCSRSSPYSPYSSSTMIPSTSSHKLTP